MNNIVYSKKMLETYKSYFHPACVIPDEHLQLMLNEKHKDEITYVGDVFDEITATWQYRNGPVNCAKILINPHFALNLTRNGYEFEPAHKDYYY